MQVQNIASTNSSFGRYDSYLFGVDYKYPTRRLHALARKCDILVKEERVPWYLNWLKGNSVFNIIVGRKKGNCDVLIDSSHTLSATITEKQLSDNNGIITRTAVKFAKELGYIA